MSRTYTFNQCYELLNVDPKTFRGWLQEAGIDPDHQVSRADRRVRFLTQEQLDVLAEAHGRRLNALHAPDQPVTPGAYKLLVDRVTRTEQVIQRWPHLLQESRETLLQEVTEQQEQAFADLRALMTQQIAEIQQVVEEHHRQYESLAGTVTVLQEQRDRLQADLAEQLSRLDEALITTQAEREQRVHADLREALAQQAQSQSDLMSQRRKEADALLHRHTQEMEDALQAIRSANEESLSAISQYIKQIEAELGQLTSSVQTIQSSTQDLQTRADEQGRQLQEVRALLQDEEKARRASERKRTGKAQRKLPLEIKQE